MSVFASYIFILLVMNVASDIDHSLKMALTQSL